MTTLKDDLGEAYNPGTVAAIATLFAGFVLSGAKAAKLPRHTPILITSIAVAALFATTGFVARQAEETMPLP